MTRRSRRSTSGGDSCAPPPWSARPGATSRRCPPSGSLPRDGATREEALLDAAALGDAVRRAGRVADPAPEPDDPAPAETLAVAPSGAVQLLELLVTQGPVGGASRGVLTVHWFDTAAAAGRVVPPRLLPQVLDLATTSAVRRAARAVVGERGRWLAARNPDWSWVTRRGAGRAGGRPGERDRGPPPRRPRRRARPRGADLVHRRRAAPGGGRGGVAGGSGSRRRAVPRAAASTTGPGRSARRPAGCSTACPAPPGPPGWPTGCDRCSRPTARCASTWRSGCPTTPTTPPSATGSSTPARASPSAARWLAADRGRRTPRGLDRGDARRARQGRRDAAPRRRPRRHRCARRRPRRAVTTSPGRGP